MGKKDKRVDAYIDKSADFARPILTHLRGIVHETCPDVEETMKWSFPHFMYEGMLCSMASFKEHCAFGFWKGSLIVDQEGEKAKESMGHFGRITSLGDLPPKKVIAGYIEKAMALNESGTKAKPKPKRPRNEVTAPDDFVAALKRNKKAYATYESFTPSARREYLEWITEAKRDETRQARMAQAIEWMAEGKPRNWKYMKP